eukprot:1875443-Lingulodinium_polyedra.AAC.1
MQRTIGSGFNPALPQLVEDKQNAALLGKLADPGFFKKVAKAARILQGWMTMFKKANRVGEPNLFSAELLAELGTSFEYCIDVAVVCQAMRMVSVELPSIKNAMIRKKKAGEFIGSHRME